MKVYRKIIALTCVSNFERKIKQVSYRQLTSNKTDLRLTKTKPNRHRKIETLNLCDCQRVHNILRGVFLIGISQALLLEPLKNWVKHLL